MALIPFAIQAQPSAVSTISGKPVPVLDLSLMVIGLAIGIVFLKFRKKLQVA